MALTFSNAFAIRLIISYEERSQSAPQNAATSIIYNILTSTLVPSQISSALLNLQMYRDENNDNPDI